MAGEGLGMAVYLFVCGNARILRIGPVESRLCIGWTGALRIGLTSSFCRAWEPGVARRLLTFLASPRKVSKRRRPEVRRPAKARGTLRYSKRQAAAELGLEWLPRKRFRLCSPSDSPRGRPLSFLRYSATLIGTRSHFHRRRYRQGLIRFDSERTWLPVCAETTEILCAVVE